MFLASLTERGATPALVHVLSYTQQRHRVIAENIANADTPGYKAKRLDPKAFQSALSESLSERGGNSGGPLRLRSHEEFEVDGAGSLRVHPSENPQQNLLFHDGTAMSIEQEMSDLASNAMMHQAATALLKGRFDMLMNAIRGRV